MQTTFKAYFDDMNTITAELALTYYDGQSSHFTLIDEYNTYLEVDIRSSRVEGDKRVYELYAEALMIGKAYDLADEHFLKAPLETRFVVSTEAFDQQFFINDDLGSFYSEDSTVFRVWAPTASKVVLDLEGDLFTMARGDRGLYTYTVLGHHEGKRYKYIVKHASGWKEACDPYALSSTPNHTHSVVIDPNKIQVDYPKADLPQLKGITDAVIYELHVRDFSVDASSGINMKGKFLGLTEEGTLNPNGNITGLDYLASLGVTHIQLLPVYDFGSVDELNPEKMYNWGYDPVQYGVPEGSYASQVADPYSRILDLQAAVKALNSKGLRVVMDVVYNHMFDRFTSPFEALVPSYYFRTGPQGQVSNGSFCGNDLDSTRKMTRKYILDSLERWMTLYGMDGFRFDLMGILDVETMNQVASRVKSLNDQAVVYGEGWDMPTLLDDKDKATMFNQHLLPEIGHFNDLFRDTLKGGSMEDQALIKGVALGDLKNMSLVSTLLQGSTNNHKKGLFDAPWKSINYVECHDNQTVYDKMLTCGIPDTELKARAKLMLALVMFSKGVPFIHAGQEFLRTKDGHHNSYLSSDAINKLDWLRRDTYADVVSYLRDAIRLRKDLGIFSEMTEEKIKVKVKKLKKIIECHYPSGHKLVVNLGLDQEIKLKNEVLIFTKDGLSTYQGQTYHLSALEVIVTGPLKDLTHE